jgi:hypothetical protein
MRYFLLIISIFPAHAGFAQSSSRLKIISSKKHTTEARKFVDLCLSKNYDDDLLPNYSWLDTVKHINAFIRAEPAIKFRGECDGIYYYLLRSGWAIPTFRGGHYDYEYLVILGEKIIAFKANDAANAEKFQRIRRELVKIIGVQKTDSIKPHLISGYAQF